MIGKYWRYYLTAVAAVQAFLLTAGSSMPAFAYGLSGSITDYADYSFADNESLAKIRKYGNFMGRDNPGTGLTGWLEYVVDVDVEGWYEALLEYDTTVFDEGWACHLTEYSVDGRYLNDYPQPVSPGLRKAGNIWMDKGKHTFRIENRNWYTRAPLTGYRFRRLGTELAENIRVGLDGVDDHYGGSYYAVNEPFALNVYSAGEAAGRFSVDILRADDLSVVRSYHLMIPRSATEIKHTISVAVSEEGSFVCRFKANGKEIEKSQALRRVAFTTIDTSPAVLSESVEDVQGTLVYTVDCVSSTPDYERGSSRVVTDVAGGYRETGRGAWDYYAYMLPAVSVDHVYFVEADIPDDGQRAIQIQFRESDPVHYVIGPGVETGFPYDVSGKRLTHRFVFWPRIDGERPRIAVVNVGGSDSADPAAVGALRLYRVDGELPALKRRWQGRQFANWIEEPGRWLDPYGAKDKSADEALRAAKNWARTMRHMGETTMFPTVEAYGEGLYPSDYRYSSKYTGDLFKMLLLVAEKYGLNVVADFSPKPGTLAARFHNKPDPARFEIFSYDKDGNHYDYSGSMGGGYYNVAHPEVRSEIKNKMAEFAWRYKNCKALAGASIRVMNWQAHAMTYFMDINHGYEPYTGKLFSSFLGIDDPGTPQKRHRLFNDKYRDEWIGWRVMTVNTLMEEITDTCRAMVPDFMLYATVHGSKWAVEEAGRAAGIDDPAIDGLCYVNAFHPTGRRRDSWKEIYEMMFDTAVMKRFAPSRAHLFGFRYFEDGGRHVSGSSLGLKGEDGRWISAHLSPAGDYALQRYALALAATDAVFLGNGGNTYSIDPLVAREFLADYIMLPRDRFTAVFDGPRIVVRELQGSDYHFYIVNKTDALQSVILQFEENASITRLSTEENLSTDGSHCMEVTLRPFRVYSFKTSGSRIYSARVNDPAQGEYAVFPAIVDYP